MAYRSPTEERVDQEVARITASYATRVRGVEPAELEAVVCAEFASRSGATIREYVAVFVERSVRRRYGLATAT